MKDQESKERRESQRFHCFAKLLGLLQPFFYFLFFFFANKQPNKTMEQQQQQSKNQKTNESLMLSSIQLVENFCEKNLKEKYGKLKSVTKLSGGYANFVYRL